MYVIGIEQSNQQHSSDHMKLLQAEKEHLSSKIQHLE
jgi:hypothetical protein